MDAMKQGYSGFIPRSPVYRNDQKIKKILPEIWAVVTATGIKGAISQHFLQSDFDRVALLVNMSTGDDFGSHFTQERVLNGKKPANFMLDFPTMVMYLDATFTLFLKAGEELLTNPTIKNGLNTIAPEIDQTVLADWMDQHGDEIWRHRLGRIQTENSCNISVKTGQAISARFSLLIEGQGIFHYRSKSPSSPHLPPTPVLRC